MRVSRFFIALPFAALLSSGRLAQDDADSAAVAAISGVTSAAAGAGKTLSAGNSGLE